MIRLALVYVVMAAAGCRADPQQPEVFMFREACRDPVMPQLSPGDIFLPGGTLGGFQKDVSIGMVDIGVMPRVVRAHDHLRIGIIGWLLVFDDAHDSERKFVLGKGARVDLFGTTYEVVALACEQHRGDNGFAVLRPVK